jgi:predicted permease
MDQVIIKLMPVFLILISGVLLRKTRLFPDDFIVGIKTLVVTLTLPATLFLSFLTMELRLDYLALSAATFLFLGLLYAVGVLYRRTGITPRAFSEYFHTCFEFGMLGVALFAGIFGSENLYALLLLGLGHELFAWFFYVPTLVAKSGDRVTVFSILRSFISSPAMVAIMLALLINATGAYSAVASYAAAEGVIGTLEVLSAATSPLILIIIGYEIKIEFNGLAESLKLILVRMITIGVLGTGFILLTNLWILPVDSIMLYAFVTLLVLPPPFIIPIFLPKTAVEENKFYNNAIVLHTIISLIGYTVILFFIL